MSPTKVDFYLLAAPDARARLMTACRLAEKACDQGLRVAVRTSGPAETAEVDECMWTFSDRSFVPHGVLPADPEFDRPAPPERRGRSNKAVDGKALSEEAIWQKRNST